MRYHAFWDQGSAMVFHFAMLSPDVTISVILRSAGAIKAHGILGIPIQKLLTHSVSCEGHNFDHWEIYHLDVWPDKLPGEWNSKQLFTQKGRNINHIPPTCAALLEHSKRAAHQGRCSWETTELLLPVWDIPSPEGWGWNGKGESWKPSWTTLPQASQACRELLKCGCLKGCKLRACTCRKAGLSCTKMGKCGGECGTSWIRIQFGLHKEIAGNIYGHRARMDIRKYWTATLHSCSILQPWSSKMLEIKVRECQN